MGLNSTFWRGKRVFLTGHTGFKGGWLSLWLQTMGADLIGFALPPPTNPNLYDIAKVGDGMGSIIGDIRDDQALLKATRLAKPEIVIHMAAQPLVRYSYKAPVETFATNVMGVVNLLQAVRQIQTVRAVIIVTSDKCYENKEWVWGYRETDPMGGFDPYSSSKACAELITTAYRNSYFNPEHYQEHGVALATVRAGNVIGGGDWAEDRLVPDIMCLLMDGKAMTIRNPNAIRPWQHVLEPLYGYLLLAQRLYEEGATYAEGWNFGPREEDAKPVQWVIDMLMHLWGDKSPWISGIQVGNPHEAHYLKLDCAKARLLLNWQPHWHLHDSLNATVDWYMAYQAGECMRKKTIEQISRYMFKAMSSVA